VLIALREREGAVAMCLGAMDRLWAHTDDRVWIAAGICARAMSANLEADPHAVAFIARRIVAALGGDDRDASTLAEVFGGLVMEVVASRHGPDELWTALLRRTAEEFDLAVPEEAAAFSPSLEARYIAQAVFGIFADDAGSVDRALALGSTPRLAWLREALEVTRLDADLAAVRQRLPRTEGRAPDSACEMPQSPSAVELPVQVRFVDQATSKPVIGVSGESHIPHFLRWTFRIPTDAPSRLQLEASGQAVGSFQVSPLGHGSVRICDFLGVFDVLGENRLDLPAQRAAASGGAPVLNLSQGWQIQFHPTAGFLIVELRWIHPPT